MRSSPMTGTGRYSPLLREGRDTSQQEPLSQHLTSVLRECYSVGETILFYCSCTVNSIQPGEEEVRPPWELLLPHKGQLLSLL